MHPGPLSELLNERMYRTATDQIPNDQDLHGRIPEAKTTEYVKDTTLLRRQIDVRFEAPVLAVVTIGLLPLSGEVPERDVSRIKGNSKVVSAAAPKEISRAAIVRPDSHLKDLYTARRLYEEDVERRRRHFRIDDVVALVSVGVLEGL